MSSHVLRFEKKKSISSIKGISDHNYRVGLVINADVEAEHTHIVVYQKYVNTGTDEAIKKEIEDKKIKPRKNAVYSLDFIASASPDFFRPDNPDEYGKYDKERVNIFNKRLKKWLDNTFGDQVMDCILHLNEGTPHWHFNIIPTEFDEKKNKWKLNAKNLTKRENLVKWQAEFCEMFDDFDFNYKKKSKAKHQTVKKYYEMANKTVEEDTLIKELVSEVKVVLEEEYEIKLDIKREGDQKKIQLLQEESLRQDDYIEGLENENKVLIIELKRMKEKVEELLNNAKNLILKISKLEAWKRRRTNSVKCEPRLPGEI